MRRWTCLGLALVLLFSAIWLPGCAQRPSEASPEGRQPLSGGASDVELQQEEAAASPEGVQAELEAPQPPAVQPVPMTQEYGRSDSYSAQEGAIEIRANHPVGDIAALDQAVLDWLTQTAQAYQAELEEGEGGSLTADYGSYEVNGREVSALVVGTLGGSHANRPRNVSATFNADRETGEVLKLEDLVVEGQMDTLRQMAAQRAGRDAGDEGLFSRWLLTSEGLRLYLDDAAQEYVEFTYLELLGVLLPRLREQGIDPDKPMIALTFDDGPSQNTPHILDLFAAFGGKATFFVVGSRLSAYPDTLSRAASEGHEIGIHTWSHTNLTTLSVEDIKAEIMNTQEAVQQYAGVTCAAVRPPGGSVNDTVKATAGELGFSLVNWSIDTEDWKTRDADATYQAIMDQACDGAIVLCHDLYESTASAMDRVIPELIAQGYQLVTVSELLSYSEDGMQPGRLYRYR